MRKGVLLSRRQQRTQNAKKNGLKLCFELHDLFQSLFYLRSQVCVIPVTAHYPRCPVVIQVQVTEHGTVVITFGIILHYFKIRS